MGPQVLEFQNLLPSSFLEGAQTRVSLPLMKGNDPGSRDFPLGSWWVVGWGRSWLISWLEAEGAWFSFRHPSLDLCCLSVCLVGRTERNRRVQGCGMKQTTSNLEILGRSLAVIMKEWSVDLGVWEGLLPRSDGTGEIRKAKMALKVMQNESQVTSWHIHPVPRTRGWVR